MRERILATVTVAALVLTGGFLPTGAAEGEHPDEQSGEAGLTPPEEVQEAMSSDGPSILSHRTETDSPVPSDYWLDTSDFMSGQARAEVVFLESDGSEETETEDWDPSRKDKVLQEIRDGLDFWEAEHPTGRLSFSIGSQTIDTGVEPIRHPGPTGSSCDNQWTWIQDTTDELGYGDTELDCDSSFSSEVYFAVRSYVHDVRNRQDVDWAFVIYVVDSLNDDDGYFEDDWFAYAYRNGPFMVMTYDNDNWGIDNMDRVTAHETGHIFGATDEYNGVHEKSGYFWADETDDSGCIMDDNSWCVSQGTNDQIGWLDSDDNARPDTQDTTPVIHDGVDAPEDPTNDPTLDFAGDAHDEPVPAAEEFRDWGYHNYSINEVTDVRWTVDGGDERSQPATAPFFEEASWSFATDPLADGEHTVETTVANEVGASDPTPVTRSVVVDTTPPVVDILNPAPGQIHVAGQASTDHPTAGDEADPVIVGNVLDVETTATDERTGVASTEISIDGTELFRLEDSGDEATIVTGDLPGSQHHVIFEATDEAGNTATVLQPYRAAP